MSSVSVQGRIRDWAATDAVQGLIMTGAMVVAGGFDALVSIVSGRMLPKEQFAVFVAVTALLQVLVHVTNVIRNVVAYYTAELTAQPGSDNRIGTFFRKNWRWGWRWGFVATLVMLLLSPFIAQFMRIDSTWPLWTASLALLMLFVRPVTDGTLQGIQQFIGLSSVQVLQSFLRLVFAIILIGLGLQAVGAILALPLATTAAVLAAVLFLLPQFRTSTVKSGLPQISWRYSLTTLIGLLAFALLVNIDAIAVKRYFSPEVAGDYGTVVTLGKICLFATMGIGLVLFPKATRRHAAGQDARPVLLLALAGTFLIGFVVTLLFFLAGGLIVQTIFTDVYSDPGLVLGLVGIATTLFAAINIWLNYALSLNRRSYIVTLALIVGMEIAALAVFHDSLQTIVSIMILTGFLGNLIGGFILLRPR